jgi:hypothetical protein
MVNLDDKTNSNASYAKVTINIHIRKILYFNKYCLTNRITVFTNIQKTKPGLP